MITSAITVLCLVTVACVAGSLASAHRKGLLSLDRVGFTMVVTFVALVATAVLVWVLFLSQIHIG